MKHQESQANYISPEDFAAVVEAARNMGYGGAHPDDVEFLLMSMYWGALRVSEALRVTPVRIQIRTHRDTGEKTGTIYLGDTKTRRNDDAVMPPQLMAAYESWAESRRMRGVDDREPVVPLSRFQVLRMLRRIGTETGIISLKSTQRATGEKVGTHLLRKSLGKDMLWGTHGPEAPVNTIAAMLRHDSTRTTEKYLRQEKKAAQSYWREAARGAGA